MALVRRGILHRGPPARHGLARSRWADLGGADLHDDPRRLRPAVHRARGARPRRRAVARSATGSRSSSSRHGRRSRSISSSASRSARACSGTSRRASAPPSQSSRSRPPPGTPSGAPTSSAATRGSSSTRPSRSSATASFGLLALTSALFLLRHFSLKSKRLGGWFSFLPSIRDLDHIEVRLLGTGVGFLTLALIFGVGLLGKGHLRGRPREARGHGRRLGRVPRGPRAADGRQAPRQALRLGLPRPLRRRAPIAPGGRPEPTPAGRAGFHEARPMSESCLFVIGATHRTAPLEIRERLALASESGLREDLAGVPGLRELAILCTCNRVEFYGVGDGDGAADSVQSAFCARQLFRPGRIQPDPDPADRPRGRPAPLRGRERARLAADRRKRGIRPGEGRLCGRAVLRHRGRRPKPRLPEGLPGCEARAHPHGDLLRAGERRQRRGRACLQHLREPGRGEGPHPGNRGDRRGRRAGLQEPGSRGPRGRRPQGRAGRRGGQCPGRGDGPLRGAGVPPGGLRHCRLLDCCPIGGARGGRR